MKRIIPYIIFIVFLSCSDGLVEECKVIQEWKVQNYKIEKKQCPDLVLAHYFQYKVSVDGKTNGTSALRIDSCIFTWEPDNKSFLTLDVCDNSFQELKLNKIPLDVKTIDSVTIFSKKLNQTQLLTSKQVELFTKDWNNSIARGYSDESFDSAFSVFPAYQYKLTVFYKGTKRPFYGYNYLVLDSSNWKFEIGQTGDLKYFDSYWKR